MSQSNNICVKMTLPKLHHIIEAVPHTDPLHYLWANYAYIEGILPKGPYLPCVSMAGRALLTRCHRHILLNLAITGSDYGLSPVQCWVIIWTNAAILLIKPLGNWNLNKKQQFSDRKINLKIPYAKQQPHYVILNVLTALSSKLTE